MKVKNVFIALGAFLLAYAFGFYTAQSLSIRESSELHAQVSAIARARNIDILSKEIELLILSYRRSSGMGEKDLDAFCKVISNKLQQAEEDRAIVEMVWAKEEPERAPGLEETQKYFSHRGSRQIQVAKDAAKQFGCT